MTCYICHDPTTETCACACKPAVHAHCLLKSIKLTNNPTCTICQGAIANVRLHTRHRLSRYVGCFATMLGGVTLACSLAALLLLALAVEEKRMHQFYELIIGCSASVAMATIASSSLRKLLQDYELELVHTEYKYTWTTR